MEFFPVQYSTLSAKALGEQISVCYGISVQHCSYLLRGVSDTYLVVGDQDKYIFKVYRDVHRSQEEIKGEIALLQSLAAGGAQIACAIPATDGNVMLALQAPEGLRHGVLFTFAKGKALAAFDEVQLETIGREMAFNHNITATLQLQDTRKPYDMQTTMLRPLELLKPAFETYYPEGYALLERTAGLVMQKLATYDTASFSMGYCHFDYFPQNFFFDEENRFTLFDFDFAGKGFLAYDLATLFCHFFFDTAYRQKPEPEARAEFDRIVAGYRQLRSISGEELEAMPLLTYQVLLFYLGFQYEHFEDWSNTFFNTRYLKERLRIMEKLAEVCCGLGHPEAHSLP